MHTKQKWIELSFKGERKKFFCYFPGTTEYDALARAERFKNAMGIDIDYTDVTTKEYAPKPKTLPPYKAKKRRAKQVKKTLARA